VKSARNQPATATPLYQLEADNLDTLITLDLEHAFFLSWRVTSALPLLKFKFNSTLNQLLTGHWLLFVAIPATQHLS
jgi:hypothetical protein